MTATRGELGSDTIPPEELARIRSDELVEALAILGVKEHHWFDYPDGGCGALEPAEPVARLVDLIESVRPDTILGFGPDGGTWHTDHIATYAWTVAALAQSGLDARHLCATNSPAKFGQMLMALPSFIRGPRRGTLLMLVPRGLK